MTLPFLILIGWAIYLGGVAVSVIQYGVSRPLYVFGLIAVLGLVAGISAVRGAKQWHLLAAFSALAFLALAVWRHAEFIATFARHYSISSALLNQYLTESMSVVRRDMDQQAFLSLFMYTYHEWIMPLIQVVIFIAVARAWVRMRSNPTFQGTLRDKAAQRP